LIDCASDGVVLVEDNIHVYVNRRFLDIFGYSSQEEIVGKPLSALVHPQDLDRISNYIGRNRKGQAGSQVYEFRGIRKDGTTIYLEGSDTGIAFRGRAVGMCFVRDITHRKEEEEAIRRLNSELEQLVLEGSARLESTNRLLEQEIAERKSAEAALRASEARYRAIVQDQSELLCRFLPDTTLTFVNNAFCRFFGMSQEDLVGRSFLPLMSEGPTGNTDIRRFVPRTLTWSAETAMTRCDGQKRWLQWTGRAVRDGKGRAVEFQGVGRDTTEAKLAEEKRKATEIALRESEEKFRVLAENTVAGIVIYRKNRLLYTNPAMSAMTGYTREELAQMTVLDTVHSDSREEALKWSRAVVRGERVAMKGESRTISRSGEDRWVDVTVGKVLIDNEPAMIATLIDVTARKAMENALRQRVDDIEKLYETSRDLLQHTRPEKIYEEVCCIGVERFGLPMVWIGLVDEGRARVRPVTSCSRLGGIAYPDAMVSETGFITRGPVRRAVVSMQPTVTNSIREDRRFEPWRKVTLEKGCHAFAAFPLIYDREVFGVIGCYGEKEDYFTDDRLHLYESFANLAASAIADARLLVSLSRQRDEVRAMASRLAVAEESERKQLARELHDRVGQNLTALSINLNILRASAASSLEYARVDDCLSLLNEMSDTIRNVMGQLRPSLLDEYGLFAALREDCNRFSKRYAIEAEVQGDGRATGLPPQSETSLFRIAQEALNNVVKHAHAQRVVITLKSDTDSVQMAVTDDGEGFAAGSIGAPGSRRGWGLTTMAERADAIGGFFRIESVPGRGTTVTVEVPR
jgi:PAS domain S-box-containing protein